MEQYLVDRVEELGGFTRKVIYQGRKGSPDRWCFFPGGKLVIVECKTKGELPEPRQYEEIGRLVRMGFNVHVVDSKEQVDACLNAEI